MLKRNLIKLNINFILKVRKIRKFFLNMTVLFKIGIEAIQKALI